MCSLPLQGVTVAPAGRTGQGAIHLLGRRTAVARLSRARAVRTMASQRCFVGVDFGTSGARATVIDGAINTFRQSPDRLCFHELAPSLLHPYV